MGTKQEIPINNKDGRAAKIQNRKKTKWKREMKGTKGRLTGRKESCMKGIDTAERKESERKEGKKTHERDPTRQESETEER